LHVRGIVDIVGMAKLAPISGFSDADYGVQFDVVLRHASWRFRSRTHGGRGRRRGHHLRRLHLRQRMPANEVVYGASKAALHHLARAAAVELGPRGVRVNAIAPGFTRTPRLNKLVSDERWDGHRRGHSAGPGSDARRGCGAIAVSWRRI
jgi:NAD(P)-dependent dehydrogenase (short-subunit alcohol dehydrogenase family)